MLNSFDYVSEKETLKAETFHFQPFLNSILSERCPKSSHSSMRKPETSNEAAIWNPSQIICCRPYRIFHLTWKKFCWRNPGKREKKKKKKKLSLFFPPFWGLKCFGNSRYLCSSNHRIPDRWLHQSHWFALVHRWCYSFVRRSNPFNSQTCWADVVKILMPSGNNEHTPKCISCSALWSQRDHFDSICCFMLLPNYCNLSSALKGHLCLAFLLGGQALKRVHP